ncbi:MAG: hypothetical protein AB7N65_13120 [Vicinamibacterales bacterium]
MIHTVPNTERMAAPFALTIRWLDSLRHAAPAVVWTVLRQCGLGTGTPELRMSREWLDEHERHARKHDDYV